MHPTKPSTSATSDNDHRTTGRVLDVVELLANARQGLTLSAMSTALACAKSSLFPLLKTLLRRGYILCDDTGRYRLSTRIFELGAKSIGEQDVRDVARPALKQLSERTGEAVLLAVLASDKTAVLYVDKIENQQHRIRYSVGLGERRPLHSSSTGRIFLAHMSETQLRDVLATIELVRYTSATITSKKALLRELEQIRLRGICINADQSEVGRCAIAAPIFDHNREVVAACALGGPTDRLKVAFPALTKAVKETALTISHTLGFVVPQKAARVDA